MPNLLTPTQARYYLVLSYLQGRSPPVWTEASQAFATGAGGTLGLSEEAPSAEVVDATIALACAVGLPTIGLDGMGPVILFVSPRQISLVKDRSRELVREAGSRGDRVRTWLTKFRLVERPWLVSTEPTRWVSVGFEATSPLLPSWMGGRIAPLKTE